VAVPPAPVHTSVNTVVVERGPTISDPETGFEPVHPSNAIHDEACDTFHVRVEVAPVSTLEGFAPKRLKSGTGFEPPFPPPFDVIPIVTVDVPTLPCALVQASVYVVVALRGPTICVPEVARTPDQP
jgi:hypothetical protein